MDAWAEQYGQRANFLCVGCAGADQARMMQARMNLKHCTVGYVATKRDMPKWGQLGCNGFIVLDQDLGVVSKATSAYNKVQQLGFRHVEALVDSLIQGMPPPDVCPGQFVRLRGLKARPELNGLIGLCLDAPVNRAPAGSSQEKELRYPVQILQQPATGSVDSHQVLAVKRSTLELLEDADRVMEELEAQEDRGREATDGKEGPARKKNKKKKKKSG